jgi:hypothetical protein
MSIAYYSAHMDDPFEPTPRRVSQHNILSLRLNETGRAWVQGKADKFAVTQTEIVKAALAYAAKNTADFEQMVKGRKG